MKHKPVFLLFFLLLYGQTAFATTYYSNVASPNLSSFSTNEWDTAACGATVAANITGYATGDTFTLCGSTVNGRIAANITALSGNVKAQYNIAIESGASVMLSGDTSLLENSMGLIFISSIINSGGSFQLSAYSLTARNITVSAGTFDAANATLVIYGNLTYLGGTFTTTGSTVKLTDGNHTLDGVALNNLQWDSSLTAVRTVTINGAITHAGTFNLSGSSSTNKVSFTGTGSVSPAVTLTNCTSTVTGINCPVAQTITFNALPNKTFGDAPFNLGATASSGLDVTYTATGNCTVAGTPVTTVSLTGVGSCTITASQGGNGSYSAATNVVQTFSIAASGATGQTITFNALPNKTVGDAPFALGATASSNLTVTYTATGNCTVAGTPVTTVTVTGVGSCTITASQAGNGSYLAATEVVQTFSISEKVNTPVTPSTPPLPDYLGLFLQIDGTGHGKVTIDTGLSCQSSDCQVDTKTGALKCNPQACTQLEKTTSVVTLTPVADSDSVFSSWGGNEDCIDGQVFMNGGKLCIAYFHRIYDLTLSLQGEGQVTGEGIECGTKCQASYESGTMTTLQATPATGQDFLGWGGDCEGGRNPLKVAITKEMTCEARFGVIAPPTPPVVPTTVETPPVVPATVETPPVVPATVETPPVVTETTSNVPTTSPVTPVTTPPVTTPVETTPVTTPVTTPPVTMPPVETTTPAVTTSATTTGQVLTSPTPVETTPPPVSKSEDLDSRPVEVTPAPVVTLVPVMIVGANFACATTGNIGEVCNYGGREVTNLNVQGTGIVSNGLLNTTVVNTGWVSNFHITATGKLSGGVVTGYIVNEGIMRDFDFKGMSIIGGILGGVITNTSKVGGYFQDVTLQANTKITGGSLKGTIKGDKNAPALLENVRVKSGSKLSGVKLGKNVKLEKGVVVKDK